MKKLLAMILAVAMVLSLAACGGDEAYEDEAYEDEAYEEAETQVAEEPEYEEDAEYEDDAEYEEEAADPTAPVSDESFAALQEAFAELVGLYDQVVELYSADEIAADATINENLTKAKDIMTTMAGITKESITELDAANLMEAMGMIAEALGMIVDQMAAA